MDKIPPDRLDAILSAQAVWFPRISWAAGVLGPPIAVTVIAGVMLFVFRFFYASELTFRQSLTIVASSFAALALISTPLLLSVLALKGDWTIAPQEALGANFSLLLEKQTANKALWTLLASLDLFVFWVIFLLSAGYAAVNKRSWSWALPGIAVPWAIWVAGKVGLSFFF